MSFWKRFTGVALLFALGFLAGATVFSSFDWHPAAHGSRHGSHGPSPLSGSFYAGLDLSEEQMQAVESILQRYRLALGELRKSMAPRIHEMLTEAEQEIEPIFDAEQLARHKAQLSQWEEQHRRRIEKKKQEYDSPLNSWRDRTVVPNSRRWERPE